MNFLIVIPARGGSKGIPKKNIKALNGKALINYTIDVARELFSDNIICVSTDDSQIIEIVEGYGLSVPFVRPNKLATDTAGSYEVIKHAIDFYSKEKGYDADVVLLLQPTSPFRLAAQVQEAIASYDSDIDMVLSVKKSKASPYFNLYEDVNGYLEKSKPHKYTRRQDCPDVWEANGAIYVINVKSLKEQKSIPTNKVKKYIMDDFTSHDLDNMYDWRLAELLINF